MKTNARDIVQTDNEAEQPGQLDNSDDHREYMLNLKDAKVHFADWRLETRGNYDFFASKQWDEMDARKLQDENRPIVTFNRTARTVNAVCGLEIQNRQEVRYLPRKIGDPQCGGESDMLTDTAKWIRESCDAEDEESEMWQDDVICGMGWTETRTSMEDDENGRLRILIERRDPLDMVVDHLAKKANCVDARFVAYIKQMNRKEFEERFPDEDFISGNFWNSDVDSDHPHDATNAWRYENDQSDKLSRKNSTWVAQYQTWEKENFYKILTPDANIVDFPEEKFSVMKPELDKMGLKYIKYQKKVYKECFLNSVKILEERPIGCNHFTFQCVTGFRDRNNNVWFGLVQLMKDPQRWANKWLSQVQHIVNSGAKNGLLAEEGAIKDRRKFEDEWSLPGSISELNPGGLTKIQQKEAPRYPDGIDKLMQYALQSINDVPGVNLEMIGMANRDQPVGLEETRKQAGVTMLATLFNSLRRYRKNNGRVLAYFIREYVPEGELIKVNGQQGAQYIPFVKDKLAFDFDIIVDDAPTSTNMKERVYPILTQMVQLALSAHLPIPPDILDYAPLPDNLIQKWKAQIINAQNDPKQQQMQQIQAMLAQLEVQQKQADLQKTGSEMTLNYAKSEQAHATGLDQAAIAQQRMDSSQADQQIAYEEILREQARKDLESVLSTRLKSLQAVHGIHLKHAETAAKIEMQDQHTQAKIDIAKQQARTAQAQANNQTQS